MKKKILGGIAVLVIVAVAVWNVNLSSQTKGMSNIMLANVEALAGESSDGSCKWKQVSCGIFSGSYEACLTNGDGNTCSCGTVTRDC